LSKLKHLGTKGEQIAQNFLQNKGYTILHTNYRIKHKEVDIICKYNDILVFIEIKTRSNTLFGFPEEAITKSKIRYLKACAEEYLVKYNNFHKLRFDVISIIYRTDDDFDIMHFEDAFY
jgi:putative endonuclease